jgi:hypothetical protein
MGSCWRMTLLSETSQQSLVTEKFSVQACSLGRADDTCSLGILQGPRGVRWHAWAWSEGSSQEDAAGD